MNDIPFSVSLSLELKKHVSDYIREIKSISLLKRRELKPNCTLFIEILITLAIFLFAIPCSILSTAKFITLYTFKALGMILCYVLAIIPIIGIILPYIFSMCFALVECVFNIPLLLLYPIPIMLVSIGVEDTVEE